MAGTVDDLEFDIVRGLPAELKERVETWEVAGIDGVGAQVSGLGDSEFQITTIKYCASNAEANELIYDCELTQGTIVSITDDWGDLFPRCLVKHVGTDDAKKPCVYQENEDAVRVEIQWQFVRV